MFTLRTQLSCSEEDQALGGVCTEVFQPTTLAEVPVDINCQKREQGSLGDDSRGLTPTI